MIKDRVLAIYDSHFPYHVSLDSFLRFAKDFKPTKFVLGGDNWDLGIISHWNDQNFKNVGFNNIRRKIKEEAQELGWQIDNLKVAMPKAQFYYLEGNHEYWITGFREKYPQMEDMSLEGLLHLKSRKVTLVPFKPGHDTLQIGKLYFRHGHQYGSSNPIKQALERSHKSIVIGHHHGAAMWSNHSDVDDKEQHVGYLVPCFCKRNPDYGKGAPNKWLNGFFHASVSNSGNFSAGIQLVSPEGKFISQMGVEY